MNTIRPATLQDIGRIAEILVFSKRVNYRSIFQNDTVSFGEIQVLQVANEYHQTPEKLQSIWVFDDGFVKGLIDIQQSEVKQLYIEPFFVGQGIGTKLLRFAIEKFDVTHLWVLQKNFRAVSFYQRHGFFANGNQKHQEGTCEILVQMQRKTNTAG